jgi:hypothetical protein
MADITITWAKDLLRAAQTAQELGRLTTLDSPLVKLALAAEAVAREDAYQRAHWHNELSRTFRLPRVGVIECKRSTNNRPRAGGLCIIFMR